jgi:carbonic anhydrase/acetyltransferase-like protein (isoleucine patch superfamily)
MTIYSLDSLVPDLHESSKVADTATVIGNVSIGAGTTIAPHVVIRGDNELISVGSASTIREGVVIHTDPGFPLVIGDGVTIGARSMLHGCSIGSGSHVGERSVVMNGAVIGRGCQVAAKSLVTEGKIYPDGTLIAGAPAKAVRLLGADEIAAMRGAEPGTRDRE